MTERRKEEQREIQKIRIAFHESRLIGEQLLADGIISREQFSFLMLAFEKKLQDMGENL